MPTEQQHQRTNEAEVTPSERTTKAANIRSDRRKARKKESKQRKKQKTRFFEAKLCDCTTLTVGDFFKLMIPILWVTIALILVLAYVIQPVINGQDPEWERACVSTVSLYAGIGLCCATYGFHRRASTFALEENYKQPASPPNQQQDLPEVPDIENHMNGTADGGIDMMVSTKTKMRMQSIKIHAVLSTIFAVGSCAMVIFFGMFAIQFHMCVHETCGGDIFWSCMALLVSVLWVIATYLGYLDLRSVPLPDEKSPTPSPRESSMSFGARSSYQSSFGSRSSWLTSMPFINNSPIIDEEGSGRHAPRYSYQSSTCHSELSQFKEELMSMDLEEEETTEKDCSMK